MIMKRYLKLLFISVILAMTVTACGYDASKGDELADKIKADKALTQDEYADCITLCEAFYNEELDKIESLDGLTRYEYHLKKRELRQDDNYQNSESDVSRIYRELSNAAGEDDEDKDELNPENRKAFKSLKRLKEKVDKRWEKLSEKYN